MKEYLFIMENGDSCYRNATYFHSDDEAIELAQNYEAILYKITDNNKVLIYKPY